VPFLHHEIAGVAIETWALAVGVAVAVFFVSRVVLVILIRRLDAGAAHTRTEWDDVIVGALHKTRSVLLLVLALYIPVVALPSLDPARHILATVLILTLLVQCGIWANAALSSWLDTYRKRKSADDVGALTNLGPVQFVARLLIWSAVALMVLDNLGVKIGPIIAGLGVGGIAVALAVQNILGDLFGSVSIAVDKPFVVGDFLIVGDQLGKVERVGLRTTRIRSLWGEQLVFSNNDLLRSRLRNFGRMYERRILFTIGVTYQTPHDLLAKIPTIIRDAIDAQDKTRFDRSHFHEYGDFSLNFETVYYVLSPDYNVYMDIQQAINLRIHEVFENEGIEFAYPTQTIFMAGPSGGAAAREHLVGAGRSVEDRT